MVEFLTNEIKRWYGTVDGIRVGVIQQDDVLCSRGGGGEAVAQL